MMNDMRDWQCGSAKVDITPDFTIQLSGSVGELRRPEAQREPLYARVLILDDGRTRIALVSIEATIITREPADRIRAAIAGLIGAAPAAVMVHVVQNHTAPSLGHFMLDETIPVPDDCEWLRGSEDRYTDRAVAAIIGAAQEALARLTPVEVLGGRAIEGRFAFNRRAITTDGGIFMPGKVWRSEYHSIMRGIEGPIDPEVAVIAFRSRDGALQGMLLHHSCHPVCVFPDKVISGDWPGAWSAAMEADMAPGSAALVLNGCCGNLNPWSHYDPEFRCDHRVMGEALARAARQALAAGEWRPGGVLAVETEHLALPYRQPESGEIDAWLNCYREHPEVLWREAETAVEIEWFLGASLTGLLQRIERDRTLDYEIQVLRIGDFVVAGWPGEPFVEAQLALKRRSPSALTLVAHCVNHYTGYLPTREAFQYPVGRRGHEANFSGWSNLAPDALDRILETTLAMLQHRMAAAQKFGR